VSSRADTCFGQRNSVSKVITESMSWRKRSRAGGRGRYFTIVTKLWRSVATDAEARRSAGAATRSQATVCG